MPSLYEISVPIFISRLRILLNILEKGVSHVGDQKVPKLLNERVIEDMLPLRYQIQRVTDTATLMVSQLAGVPDEGWVNDEKDDINELRSRIIRTIAFLEGIPEAAFEGKEEAKFERNIRGTVYEYTGTRLLLELGLPNFYFHFVTAYGLLRKEGVQIGKPHYLGLAK